MKKTDNVWSHRERIVKNGLNIIFLNAKDYLIKRVVVQSKNAPASCVSDCSEGTLLVTPSNTESLTYCHNSSKIRKLAKTYVLSICVY